MGHLHASWSMGNFVLAEEEAEEEADLEGFGGGGEGTTGVLCFCCLSSTKRLHCSICTCALISSKGKVIPQIWQLLIGGE